MLPFIVSNIIGAIPLAIVMISYTLDGSCLPQKGGMPDFELMGIDLNVGFALTALSLYPGIFYDGMADQAVCITAVLER